MFVRASSQLAGKAASWLRGSWARARNDRGSRATSPGQVRDDSFLALSPDFFFKDVYSLSVPQNCHWFILTPVSHPKIFQAKSEPPLPPGVGTLEKLLMSLHYFTPLTWCVHHGYFPYRLRDYGFEFPPIPTVVECRDGLMMAPSCEEQTVILQQCEPFLLKVELMCTLVFTVHHISAHCS